MRILSFRPRALRFFPIAAAALGAGASLNLLAICGPFTDVPADSFCLFVEEILYLGITTGTTPTTYDPALSVSRLQMAAFLSRTVDAVARRASPRTQLARLWAPRGEAAIDVTTVGTGASYPAADGLDIWVPSRTANQVWRVRASDGDVKGTWTGATMAYSALSGIGKVFVTGRTSPGSLYRIEPRLPPFIITTVASNLGDLPNGIAFDGTRLWTANSGPPGSVSIITPGPSIPFTVTTVAAGFSQPNGILFDGANVWVTDDGPRTLLKLDSSGAVLQTVTVGIGPIFPVFDGANIWVPNAGSDSVSVVRSATGAVLATLTGNGLDNPLQAAFDGERILVTNLAAGSVSLWKAANLTAIAAFGTGVSSSPFGACSDGTDFWITFRNNQLGRF